MTKEKPPTEKYCLKSSFSRMHEMAKRNMESERGITNFKFAWIA
jgi:hypothetical protein